MMGVVMMGAVMMGAGMMGAGMVGRRFSLRKWPLKPRRFASALAIDNIDGGLKRISKR